MNSLPSLRRRNDIFRLYFPNAKPCTTNPLLLILVLETCAGAIAASSRFVRQECT